MKTKFRLSLRGKTAIIITLGLGLIVFLWSPHFLKENAASPESASAAKISGKHYNRLASEKSPYLLQHADNPIHWFPWGEEAFAAARAENKPIFLSIGYSTCHWCHVLEKESFEDDEVAAVLNQGYICIKVDREEHPDVDQMYMDVVQAMTGRGGWPMTIVMSPDMMPFFGGTYFPKEDLLQILRALDDTWKNDPEKIAAIGKQVQEFLESRSVISTSTVTLDEAVLKNAYYKIRSQSDPVFGGFGTAPKFPPTTRLKILTRITHRTGEKNALEMVSTTLEHMARGGMYDHLGGGFHRYSTDEKWLVPHFEKMLYDQAALSWAYLEGFQATQNPMFEWVARGILDYVLRDMTGPHGGFYSAEDADSEGEEGTFYLWSDQELREILTEKQYLRFAETYGVSAEGNFELLQQPTNILHLPRHVPWKVKFDPDLVSIHEKLLRHRAGRVHPFKDDKIITAWNGLMLGSMAKAYQVLGDEKYLTAAQNAARFIKANLYRDGKLLRRYRLGEAGHPGTLDDYAYLVEGLLTLYEADFDENWFHWARQLQLKQDELLWDTEEWGYFFAELNANLLPMRKKEFADNARPNSNAVATLNLLKFYNFTLENEYKNKAEQILKGIGEHLLRFPQGFSRMLVALDFYLDRAKQIAVVGPAESSEKDTIIRALQARFLPNKILAFTPPASNPSLPVLKDKVTAEGKTTVYVCEENICKYPTGDLKKILEMADDPKRYQL